MIEALNLFDEIANSKHLRDPAIILFLNKKDLFEDKYKKVPLQRFFSEFAPSTDNFEEGLHFLASQFRKRYVNFSPNREIYTHFTCATDVHNVNTVFNDVKDIIIRKSLYEAGLTGPM